MVSSGMMASVLQDSSLFVIHPITDRNVSTKPIYSTGKFANTNAIVNSYMKFNDNRIFLFNKLELNIDSINFTLKDVDTFQPRLVVDYSFDFKILFKELENATLYDYYDFSDKSVDDLWSISFNDMRPLI